jgi:hypothetical protein
MLDTYRGDDPRLIAERRALRAQGKVLSDEPMFDDTIECNPMPFSITVQPDPETEAAEADCPSPPPPPASTPCAASTS